MKTMAEDPPTNRTSANEVGGSWRRYASPIPHSSTENEPTNGRDPDDPGLQGNDEASKKKLLVALRAGKTDIGELGRLAKEIGDVNYSDRDGNTPLHHAVRGRRPDFVKFLVTEGADASVDNNDHITPLDVAYETKNMDAIRLLTQNEIDNARAMVLKVITYVKKNWRNPFAQTASGLPVDDEPIREAKTKIVQCLKSLKKLESDNSEEFSYDHANIFLHFVQALATGGSGDEVEEVLNAYLSPGLTEEDRDLVNKACENLRRLGLDDVRLLIVGDVGSFYARLQSYLQVVQIRLEIADMFSSMMKAAQSRVDESGDEPTTVTRITSCLELLNNSNSVGLSYDQVNVIISFMITSGEADSIDADFLVRRYNSVCKDVIVKARRIILGLVAKYPSVTKRDHKIVRRFFKDLKTYLERAAEDITEPVIEPIKLDSIIDRAALTNRLEEPWELKNFLNTEFESLFEKIYRREDMTPEDVFNFTVNLIPAFLKEMKKDSSQSNYSLRNNVLHDYHEYGYIEFVNELLRLRHELVRHYLTNGIHETLSVDDDAETIDEKIREVIRDSTTYTSFDTDDAIDEGFYGHQFLESMFPQNISYVENLVDRYVKFKILVDCNKRQKSELELSDSDKRKRFEVFDRVDRKSDGHESYDAGMRLLRKRLVNDHGVKDSHFATTYKFYKKNKGVKIVDREDSKVIARAMEGLKKLQNEHSLSNQATISLYDQFSVRKRGSVKNVDRKYDFEPVSQDLTMNVTVGDEKFTLRIGEVVLDLLNLFCDAHNAYRVRFDVKEVFNDDRILDHLVGRETEAVCMEEFVDLYFKVVAKIEGEGSKNLPRRQILEKFMQLKAIRQHIDDDKELKRYYLKLKKNFRAMLVNDYKVEEEDFVKVYKSFVKGDEDLTIEEQDDAERVKSLFCEFRIRCQLSNQDVASVYEKLIEGEGEIDSEKHRYLLRGRTKPERMRIVEELKDFYDLNFYDFRSSKIINDMIEALAEKLRLKTINVMRIKKLLTLDYTVPYIVKLITRTGSDDAIEKDDLTKLVGILLNDDRNSYIEHLSDLLFVKWRYLDLYDEVCDQILEKSYTIDNLSPIFNEPEHIDGILAALCHRIDSKIKPRERTVQVTKEVLRILNGLVTRLISSKETDKASKILSGEFGKRCERLEMKKKIRSTNPLVMEYKLNVAEVKNSRHMYEKSLEVLQGIPDHESTGFLSVLCCKAYAYKLLKQYEEASRAYDDLYKRIVRLALESDIENPYDEGVYSRIVKSPKYLELFESPRESNKFLDILYVVNEVAHNLLLRGHCQEDLSICQNALDICRGMYIHQKKKFGPDHERTAETMWNLSSCYSYIGRVYRCESSLPYYYRALTKANRYLIIKMNKNGDRESKVEKYVRRITQKLNNIAVAHRAIGYSLKESQERSGAKAIHHFNKALEIGEIVLELQNVLLESEHDSILSAEADIASTMKHICTMKKLLKNAPPQTSRIRLNLGNPILVKESKSESIAVC